MTPNEFDGTHAGVDAAEIDLAALPAFAAARGAMHRLLQVAVAQIAALLLLMAAALLTQHLPGRSPALDALLHDGTAGLVGAALLTSLTGTLACLLIARARRRTLDVAMRSPAAAAALDTDRRSRRKRFPTLSRPGAARRPPVTRAAGWPQVVLILAGVGAAALVLRDFPPLPPDPTAAVPGWSGIAGLMLLPAFLLLVCERLIAAEPPDRLPEAARLAALLRIPAFTLILLAALAGAAGFGFTAGRWPGFLLSILLTAVAGELALRAIAVLFLPPPPPETARAAIGSLLAALLQPQALRPAEMARRMRTQLGIDITRSWAVAYVRAAAPPVLLGLLALSWGLTGVTRIGMNERGVYERFGAPVAVLRPGLHLLPPWPFGQVRRIEYGVVHAVPVGADAGGVQPAVDTSTADGTPPLSANRLWDEQSSTDISYLIASRGAGKQSFETVSVDIRVLYRIGLDDESARRALYGLEAPDALVRALSDRLLARYFADRTLPQVLGARREQVAVGLRNALQAQLDERRSGVEVVAVVVESMHPPSGAATAYRGVQTAQILASTQRAQETGRAYGSLSVAARNAHELSDQAQALSAELVGTARSDRSQADADTLAYRDGGYAFLLERYFSDLRAAVGTTPLEIIDNRLDRKDVPMIDLRPPSASGAPAAPNSYADSPYAEAPAGEPAYGEGNVTPPQQPNGLWMAPSAGGR
jgi:regulator of protease activity HflC (stomatin/prohibitin superfamily)